VPARVLKPLDQKTKLVDMKKPPGLPKAPTVKSEKKLNESQASGNPDLELINEEEKQEEQREAD